MTLPAARWRAEAAATLALGWPIILTNLAQIALGTTDTVVLGWLGPAELAAAALGANLFFALFVFGMGLAQATAPMLAQTLGRRRHEIRLCRRVTRQGLWLCLGFALPGWVFLWHAESFLRAIGQDPALSAAAGAYLRGMQWGLLPALGFMVLRSFIAALERPRAGMVVTLVGVALNAAGNWTLVFGHWGAPKLGLVGSGIASSLSYWFMFLALLGYLLAERRFRRFRLLGRWWRIDGAAMRELLRLGIPMSLAMGFEITGFNAAAFLMGPLGTESVAAHAIALQVASITFMVPLGLGQAATVRVGLAAGAGDAEGIRRAGWTALALGLGFMAAMALVLLGLGRPIAGLFLDLGRPDTVAVAQLAVGFLAVAGLFQVADGAQVVGAGVLRGLKDTTMPMLFAGLGYWGIAIPLGWWLGHRAGMGGIGIWTGLAVGLGVVATLMVARWLRRRSLGLVQL